MLTTAATRPVRTPAIVWRRARTGRCIRTLVWLAVTAVVAWSVVRGRALQAAHPEVKLGAAPLVGQDPADGWDWRFGWGLVVAGGLAALAVAAVSTSWVWRARLRTVTAAAATTASAFALALALTDGSAGVLRGADHETEYLANLDAAPPAAEFVRTFLDRLDGYSVHVRGHPPGFVLVLKALDAVGLRGPWPVAALSVLATGATVAAVLTTIWALAGAAWVRRVAPFLAVVPYSLWMVTSADAVFTAVAASGVAALALATRWTGGRALGASLASGALFGALLHLTYLGATFALVPALVVVAAAWHRSPGARSALAGVVAATAMVLVASRWAGFWWPDGAGRTRTEYWEGTAQFREWGYFRVANLAVALIALGPAVVAGLLRLRDRRIWLVCGGAMAALAASHLSQYTRGEVERIWLLFFPWLAVAAGALAGSSRRRTAAWVGLQGVAALTLQAVLVSKW